MNLKPEKATVGEGVTGRPVLLELTAVFAIVAGAAFLLFRNVFALWWGFDDSFILATVFFQPLEDMFVHPEAYRTFSMVNFTPLVILSYAVDYRIFGFYPLGFYVHQIVAMAAVSAAIFVLARRWHKGAALWAALLFLLTGPSAVGAHILAMRHYVEGALWVLLAGILLPSPGKSIGRAWAAGFFYLLACLSKEIYVPFGLAPFFLAQGPLRRRCVISLPFWIALVVYSLWRIYMLGGLGLQGYGNLWWVHWQSWDLFAGALVQTISSIWSWRGSGDVGWVLVGLHTAGFACVLYSLYSRSGWLRAAAAVILLVGAVGVIAPVWGRLTADNVKSYRFAFHLAVLGSLCFAYASSILLKSLEGKAGLRRSVGKGAVFLGMAAVVVFAGYHQQSIMASERDRLFVPFSEENRFFYERPKTDTLVTAKEGHHWNEIARLRRAIKGDDPPAVCQMPFDMRENPRTGYYRYSAALKDFEDISARFRAARAEWLEQVTDRAFLRVHIALKGGSFEISLDASDDRPSYFLLMGPRSDTYQSVQIRKYARIRLFTRPTAYCIRVGCRLSDGRWVLSPEWRIDFSKDQEIHWSNAKAGRRSAEAGT